MQSIARHIALLVALITLAACGGGGDAAPTTPTAPTPAPPPAAVASVVITLGSPQLVVGGSTVATAETRSSTGTSLTGRTVSWSSSNPTVASVSSTGTITALSPGTTSITATSEGQSGAVALTVVPVPVATIAVSLAASNVIVGSTTVATATLRGAGDQVLTGRTLTWSTSNPAVASVNAAGVVTALTSGSTTITASSEGQSGAATLTVTRAPVSTVVVAGAGTLSVGQTWSFNATLRDDAGAVLTDRSIAWLSSNSAVAGVSASGVVSALAPGTTVISATSEGRVGTLNLTVRSSIAAVTISGGTRVKVGDQYSYSATVRLSDGTVEPRTATWRVSDPSRGSMLSTGQLTPLQAGPITLEATIEGEVWDVTVDAYDWVRLEGSSSVFHYLPADNLITNKFGSSEYARLVLSCGNTGNFFVFVMFERFVTASGNVALSFDGNPPFSQSWSEISTYDALFKPGSNAVVKSFALQVAAARVFGFAFTEFQASAKAMLFRVTGLGPRLTELFDRCPGSAIVQPATAQASASAFAEAQGVIAAFDASAGRRDALRETRRQQGMTDTRAPTAELRGMSGPVATSLPARRVTR